MSLPQHIQYQTATVVELDVQEMPSSTATVSGYAAGGGALFEDQNATQDTISTTLSSGASKGDATISVGSATGISSGREFWVRTPDEKVRCKTISGTTVTLWNPLLTDHASGVSVEGTRLQYTVTAAQAEPLTWDGRLEWTVDSANVYQQLMVCTKYNPFHQLTTEQDLFDVEPLLGNIIPAALDTQKLISNAIGEVLSRVAAKTMGRAHGYTGGAQLVRATAKAALMLVYSSKPGDENNRLYERYMEQLEGEIDRFMAFVPSDQDQDGVIEAHEQTSSQSVRMLRS